MKKNSLGWFATSPHQSSALDPLQRRGLTAPSQTPSCDFAYYTQSFLKEWSQLFFLEKNLFYATMKEIHAIQKFSSHTSVSWLCKSCEVISHNSKVYFTQSLNIICTVLKFGSPTTNRKFRLFQKSCTGANPRPF